MINFVIIVGIGADEDVDEDVDDDDDDDDDVVASDVVPAALVFGKTVCIISLNCLDSNKTTNLTGWPPFPVIALNRLSLFP